jgi:hypothetical protein
MGLANSGSLSATPLVIVRLLELDAGREEGSMELSLLRLLGLSNLEKGGSAPMATLDRLLIVEFCLLRGCGAWALHRLLTLSLRLSMALWTKPPMPFVGEEGRSARSGENLPCIGDMASARPEEA